MTIQNSQADVKCPTFGHFVPAVVINLVKSLTVKNVLPLPHTRTWCVWVGGWVGVGICECECYAVEHEFLTTNSILRNLFS